MTARPSDDLPARFERLEPLEELTWRGAYNAYDAWRDTPVTVLVMRQSDEALRARFERCFRFLALADGPWLPRALDWGELPGGHAWLSATCVTKALRPPAPADAETLVEWAVTGTRALIEAHRYGLLHRFVCPEAFLRGPDGQLGLGYWVFNGLAAEPDGLVTGVMPYIAPEALDGAPVPSSDYFALGATLYALATGHAPFEGLEGARLAEVQRQGAPSLAVARPDLPEALTALVDRLLAPEPASRFADGLAVLRALGAPLLPSINSPAVDHERPLERLMKAFESYRASSGGAIVLTGPPGAGKSTLLRQFTAEASLKGASVVLVAPRGGLDRLGVLDTWLDGRGVPAPAVPDVPGPVSQAARALVRRFAMVKRLAAAGAGRDVVFVFEDLGAHEDETLARLEQLLASHGTQVLVVASVRGEEAASGKVLARLKRHPLVRELPVPPLSESAAHALVGACLGPEVLGLAAVREAITAAAGNPFMLIETLRALVTSGALVEEPGGWRLAADRAPWPIAPSLDAALASRLERLSPLARRLGAVVALMPGMAPSRPLVASALDVPITGELAMEFQALVAERWLTREPAGYRPAHALLRPVLVRSLSPEEQRVVHGRLAVLLGALGASDAAIAPHLAASGDAGAARDAYLRAAARADEDGDAPAAFRALQEAWRLADEPVQRRAIADRLVFAGSTIAPAFTATLLEASLAGEPALSAAERVMRLSQLIGCRLLLSRYAEAHEAIVAGLADVPDDAPWLGGLLLAYRGLTELHRGCVGPAREAATEALARLATADPAALPPQAAGFWWLARFGAEVASRMQAHLLGGHNRLEDGAALQPFAEAAGAPHLASWAWLALAQGLLEEGRLPESRTALEAANALLERTGDVPTSRAFALTVEAMLNVRAGELDQALRSATAAVAFARGNTPSPYPLGLALVALAEAQLAAGSPSEAEAAASEALHLNEEGSHLVLGPARLLLARATLRRRPELARRQLEALLATASAPETLNRFHQVAAWRVLGEGRAIAGPSHEGLAMLHRAADEAERLDWPHPLALALLATGRLLKARKAFGRMQRVAFRAASIAEARGFAELRRQARQLGQFGVNSFAPLAELRRLMAHAGGLDALVSQGLSIARGLARSDRAAVYLAGEAGLALAGASPTGVDPLVSAHDMLDEVVAHQRTVWREGVVSNQTGEWLVDADVRALVAVPLVSAAGAIGVLYLDRRSALEPFTRGEVAKLESLASYLALALEQGRRPPGAPAPPEGRQARLENAFGQMLESDRTRRGLLGALSADLRHQLAELRAVLEGGTSPDPASLAAALAHAEQLAALIEKSLKE